MLGLGDITDWGYRVADEVGRLPGVLYGVRVALARLPEQIESLVDALEQTTAALERALPELTRAIAAMEERLEHVDRLASDLAVDLTRTVANLERVLPEVTSAIGGMDSRVKNLDTTLSSLGNVVVGNVLVLAAATCWSLYAVAQQRARTDASGPRLMAPIFALGTACTLLVLPGVRTPASAGGVGPTAALLVLALVCTAAVYVVYTRSQECLPLSVLSAVHATVPLFSIALAWAFLGEPMTPRLATGAITVVLGIIVAAAGR